MTHQTIEFWVFAIKRIIWLPFALVCIVAAILGRYEFATKTLVTVTLLWALTKILDEGVDAIKKIAERTSNKNG